ncbi:hypothetical protein T07_9571 [Trichinella nelsoni]|uniref:Secreted protein n=1 Tax=Trichinella nelsoni TaxID=6336 RepID=A0A0V0S1P3_9BILA|nr:hypothetical protein T07_9571 [Trichinella nelsoni]
MTLFIVCLVVVSPNEFACICGDVECKCKIECIDLLLNEVKSRNSKQQIHRKHFLLKSRRVSLVNNGWRELKETPSSNRKIPCQAIMFCVSEKRPSNN